MHIFNRRIWTIAFGLFPAAIIYIVFCIIPIAVSVYYSLMNWDGLSVPRFVGLDNYMTALSDPVFWKSFKNNLVVVSFSAFIQNFIGLLVAILLNRQLPGIKIFRTVGFMPVVISTIIVSIIWNLMLNTEIGMLNRLLELVGLGNLIQNWLGDTSLAIFSVNATITWQYIGLYMIIYLSALQTISKEVLESAEIDGATGFSKTWRITIPMLWDTIFVCFVVAISGAMRIFDHIYVMTNGGPAHATEVIATYMFQQTFLALKFGYGSALSLLIFVISLILITIVSQIIRMTKR